MSAAIVAAGLFIASGLCVSRDHYIVGTAFIYMAFKALEHAGVN